MKLILSYMDIGNWGISWMNMGEVRRKERNCDGTWDDPIFVFI